MATRKGSRVATLEQMKQKLRQACLARVRDNRAATLAAMRARGTDRAATSSADAASAAAADLAAHVRQVVADELHHHNHAGAARPGFAGAGGSGDAVMSAADALWVRHSRHVSAAKPVHVVKSATHALPQDWDASAATAGFGPDDPDAPLTEEEEAALVASLEASLAEELREEEAALLAEYEASLAQEDAAAAAAAAEYELWSEQPAGSHAPAEAVPCPVCRRRRLLCNRGVVYCACGGLRLDLSAEGAGLAHVAAQLGAAWEAHAATGCAAVPHFEQHSRFGTPALWASCSACGALAMVL